MMSSLIVEFIGYISGFLIAIALLPQVIKSWTTKSTQDISILWNLTAFIGLVLSIIYGIGISSWPLIVFGIVEALFTGSLLLLKVIYK